MKLHRSLVRAGLTVAVVASLAPAAHAAGTSAPGGSNPATQNTQSTLFTCDGQPATKIGTSGDDYLNGTSGPDVIVGLDGDDTINGLSGDDRLCGGQGDDVVRGQAGADRLFGGSGVDDCVTAAPDPPTDRCETSIIKTGFDPSEHGFDFVNQFWHDLGSVPIPGFGSVNFGSMVYGLCGGMSYAAADTFLYGGTTPATGGVTPPQGSALRKALFNRQLDSLLPNAAEVFRRFAEWQLLPLDDRKVLGQTVVTGLKSRTKRQWNENIKPKLQVGRPVPLGMVKVDGTAAPWHNHQVLAVGGFKTADDERVIAIYDPNYPAALNGEGDGITWLYMKRRRQYHDADGLHAVTPKRWRGLFATRYEKRKPYWVP